MIHSLFNDVLSVAVSFVLPSTKIVFRALKYGHLSHMLFRICFLAGNNFFSTTMQMLFTKIFALDEDMLFKMIKSVPGESVVILE
jgi:hypothetical protein